MDNITKGRNDLRVWEDSKSDNFFTYDTNLQKCCGVIWAMATAKWIQAGAEAATIIDEAARSRRLDNHPGWNAGASGRRFEQINSTPTTT
jgi:hypothetical protein